MGELIKDLGPIEMPAFAGVRVMMMPIRIDDVATVPLEEWRAAVAAMAERGGVREGVCYLTIDEAFVRAGETHRRPGLHVDGHGNAAWGGPPAPYGSSGMVLLASHVGCIGWDQLLPGESGDEGCCEHLRALLDDSRRIEMQPGVAYACAAKAAHEAVPQPADAHRQFVRLSFPNDGDWHDCYTPNPYGVLPTGRIVKGREHFMAYRAHA